jgi:hypothetical protein
MGCAHLMRLQMLAASRNVLALWQAQGRVQGDKKARAAVEAQLQSQRCIGACSGASCGAARVACSQSGRG